MWEVFVAECMRVIGRVARRSILLFILGSLYFISGIWSLTLFLGPTVLLIPALLVASGAASVYQAIKARDALWRVACLRLDDPRQPPPPGGIATAFTYTARALRHLGAALNSARRGRFVEAIERLPRIDRDLLRPEEKRLLDAVRALISLGLGDLRKAGQQAVTALPSGSEELDAILGRTVIAESWHQPDRLRTIHLAWERAGVTADRETPLARLHELTRLRIDDRLLDGLSAAEARVLSSEARAVGDDDLAANLEARGRSNAYR